MNPRVANMSFSKLYDGGAIIFYGFRSPPSPRVSSDPGDMIYHLHFMDTVITVCSSWIIQRTCVHDGRFNGANGILMNNSEKSTLAFV